MLVSMLSRYRLRRLALRHLKKLQEVAIIGEGLNAAVWQKPSAALNLRIWNPTGRRDRVVVGDHCNISCSITLGREGRVSVGDFVFMNSGCRIRCDHEVKVGNYCLFGPEVVLWDTKNHPMSASRRREQAMSIPRGRADSYVAGGAPIVIEDDVWLGLRVVVLSGVTIGQGSVVGAGSVVTKSIPPGSFAAGNPAKVIRSIESVCNG